MMPDKKLTDLSVITSAASDDLLYVVDVSDTSQSAAGSSRKIKVGDLGGGGSSVAQFTSTDTASDINVGSGVFDIPWDTTLIANVAVSQPTNQEIEVGEAGIWEFYVSLCYDVTASRINPRIRFSINGTIQDITGASGYARDASGHSQASNSIKAAFSLSAGDKIKVVTDQFASSGTATLRANESVLLVNKLAD